LKKSDFGVLESNKRIRKHAILNRSCVSMGVSESMLLGTLQNPFSTAC
jgi:hypothetical protein